MKAPNILNGNETTVDESTIENSDPATSTSTNQCYEFIENGRRVVVLDYDPDAMESNNYIETTYLYDISNIKNNNDNGPFTKVNSVEFNWKENRDAVNNIDSIDYTQLGELYKEARIRNIRFSDGSTYTGPAIPNNENKTFYKIKNFKAYTENNEEIIITDNNGDLLGNLVLYHPTINVVIITKTQEDNTIKTYVLDRHNDIDVYDQFGITATQVMRLLDKTVDDSDSERKLKQPTTYIVKKDIYLVTEYAVVEFPTFVLDGGDLICWSSMFNSNCNVICKDGSVKTYENRIIGGVSYIRIKNANENSKLSGFGGQNCIVTEFNVLDFLNNDDYNSYNSARSINLNEVVERIINSIYNHNSYFQRMVIKMPENVYGTTMFFMNKPLMLPYGVTLDLSGATVYISSDFNGGDYVFAFETNSLNKNLVTSCIKNLSVRFDPVLLNNNQYPHKVFDLTNFSGVMENVQMDLGYRTDIIGFWQPIGIASSTYSDQKVIKRCNIINAGWRNETPTAIFCYGDGCIIEQCILGYVAIICGKSYTIKGCLNDSYFFYDSVVDFNGSYWEIGQFQILDSFVSFSNCKLNASNNHFELSHKTSLRRYVGPWMAIDTDGCRERLLNIVKMHSLDFDNFNEIEKNKEWTLNGKYRGRLTTKMSTVKFDETINSLLVYWGYKQPMSGPLFKVGEGAKVIGIENLENTGHIYIHNTDPSTDGIIHLPITQGSYLPLINGNFADVKSDVKLPENVSFIISNDSHKNPGKEILGGVDWNGEILERIRVRFLLDEQRNLYSKWYTCSSTHQTKYGEHIILTLNVDMSNEELKNLKAELQFDIERDGTTYRYLLRHHFYRVVDADVYCFGHETDDNNNDHIITDNIEPYKQTDVDIAVFYIAKAFFDKEAIESQTSEYYGTNVVDVEHVVCQSDLPAPSPHALSDYNGNIFEPEIITSTSLIVGRNVASKLQYINDSNVRAYMRSLPSGRWIDGDEVVLPHGIYRTFNGQWFELMSLTEPYEPDEVYEDMFD